ncbi:MAG: hypothetical protein AVDCRST_MAG45-2034 [uncultured Solirubrobacterales bacterium]|uniref:Uncharacterized protein n=1 Tax=uncultured Solirubrobacterales bacterium TaxID=768556 RepID=A0A6J4T4U0_9ACTN|nr:MAG: hypothetical protein AVDCRST_MAG45-2034 [uncultured Solirubrobacterales bacterium]
MRLRDAPPTLLRLVTIACARARGLGTVNDRAPRSAAPVRGAASFVKPATLLARGPAPNATTSARAASPGTSSTDPTARAASPGTRITNTNARTTQSPRRSATRATPRQSRKSSAARIPRSRGRARRERGRQLRRRGRRLSRGAGHLFEGSAPHFAVRPSLSMGTAQQPGRQSVKAQTHRPTTKRVGAAPSMFLELSADGVESAPDQRSLTRRAGMVLLAAIFFSAVPLGWAMSADASDAPKAVVSKSVGASDDDDDDDDDGTASDGGTASNGATGAETLGNTDAGANAQFTGASTRGETDGADGTGVSEMTQGTGVETQGNTDAGANAQFTGASTRGETDLGDATGATEMTQGTGVETHGKTDPRADTGVSTRGETDPGDATGATEQR